jgi:hypothetical protein
MFVINVILGWYASLMPALPANDMHRQDDLPADYLLTTRALPHFDGPCLLALMGIFALGKSHAI